MYENVDIETLIKSYLWVWKKYNFAQIELQEEREKTRALEAENKRLKQGKEDYMEELNKELTDEIIEFLKKEDEGWRTILSMAILIGMFKLTDKEIADIIKKGE